MLDPEAGAVDVKENRYMSILDPDHSCVSSESVDGGFRQRCSDDEVSTHTRMLDPEAVAVDMNETDI